MAVRWWAAVAGLGPSGGSPSERTTAPGSMVGRTLRSVGGPSDGRPQKSAPPLRRLPADPPGPVPGLVLHRRVPPPVVEDDVAGGGQVEPGAAGLDRHDQRAGARPFLELLDEPVPLEAGEAAVVAGDRPAGLGGQV